METSKKFAICIFSDEDSLLIPRRISQMLPDESAGRSDYLRVIDDEGDDYLYPRKYFVFSLFPIEVEKALQQTI